MVDKKTVEAAITNVIRAIGDDPKRESLVNTPKRLADMYEEIFAGMYMDARKELSVDFEVGHHEMVILKDIPFYSMCEHHLLPFFGVAHVGYIPSDEGRVVGISKLARVVDIYAKRLQLQERMTTEIAESIFDVLKPEGVGVVIQAEHLCMIMRGIKKPGSTVMTSAMRGTFRSKAVTRNEFLSLVGAK
jgi:GTP cyclohydrolase IA